MASISHDLLLENRCLVKTKILLLSEILVNLESRIKHLKSTLILLKFVAVKLQCPTVFIHDPLHTFGNAVAHRGSDIDRNLQFRIN